MVNFLSTSFYLALILQANYGRINAFALNLGHRMTKTTTIATTTRRRHHRQSVVCVKARYGPIDDEDTLAETVNSGQFEQPSGDLRPQEAAFRSLIDNVLTVKDPQHIPSLLTKNLELILSLSSADGVQIVESILQETVVGEGEEAATTVAEVIDLIVTFSEDFVEQAVRIDDQNKNLLGKIIKTVSDKDKTDSAREQALDELLQREKKSFTAGFLRHINGECERIAAAPNMTPESTRLMGILRMIQTRVLEEVASDLGEAAQVLGQLIGYETAAERLAVLETGLMVRGPAFAKELLEMTEEALDGFQRVAGGAEPGLVECIEQIDDRLRLYLEQNNEFV